MNRSNNMLHELDQKAHAPPMDAMARVRASGHLVAVFAVAIVKQIKVFQLD
jgi:hypothetical protein